MQRCRTWAYARWPLRRGRIIAPSAFKTPRHFRSHPPRARRLGYSDPADGPTTAPLTSPHSSRQAGTRVPQHPNGEFAPNRRVVVEAVACFASHHRRITVAKDVLVWQVNPKPNGWTHTTTPGSSSPSKIPIHRPAGATGAPDLVGMNGA